MPLDLGALDRSVTFRVAVTGRDALNETVASGFETIATVRATRTPVRDGERNAGMQVEREVSDRFVTHWSAALAALNLTQQLVCEGVTYNLVGRRELGRREGLEWSAVARPDLEAA